MINLRLFDLTEFAKMGSAELIYKNHFVIIPFLNEITFNNRDKAFFAAHNMLVKYCDNYLSYSADLKMLCIYVYLHTIKQISLCYNFQASYLRRFTQYFTMILQTKIEDESCELLDAIKNVRNDINNKDFLNWINDYKEVDTKVEIF